MADPAFHRMRQDLVARGLIDEQFRLTEAGNAHAIAIIDDLRIAEPPPPPEWRGVVWRIDRRAA